MSTLTAAASRIAGSSLELRPAKGEADNIDPDPRLPQFWGGLREWPPGLTPALRPTMGPQATRIRAEHTAGRRLTAPTVPLSNQWRYQGTRSTSTLHVESWWVPFQPHHLWFP